MPISNRVMRAIEIEAIEIISQEIGEHEPRPKDALELTGVEILAFIAVKVAIPIACGLASRILYDKYKRIGSRSEAESASQELQRVALAPQDRVEVSTLITDAVAALQEEGLSEQQAMNIAAKLVPKIERTLAATQIEE
jgi:hypothetical protein